jgi:hypothetical protein
VLFVCITQVLISMEREVVSPEPLHPPALVQTSGTCQEFVLQ